MSSRVIGTLMLLIGGAVVAPWPAHADAPLLPPPLELPAPGESSAPWTPPEPEPAAGPALESRPPAPSSPTSEELPLPGQPWNAILPDDALPPDGHGWHQPQHWFGPTPWDTGIELGINGSSGTSDSISIRAGGYIKRQSRFSKLDLNAHYNRTNMGGQATQDNAQFDVRNDWLLDESSPWTLFSTANVFYDHFAAYDAQSNVNAGVGYHLVSEPGLSLLGRLGAGASREFGGPDDRWVPESLVGFEYCQDLSLTQKVYAKLDYYPEWDQVGEYRLVADAGWEVALLDPSNLSLKLSASDRYDSTPGDANPHLVNYSVLLLWKL